MNTPLFELKNLSLKVATKESPILKQISLNIYPEDFIVLLGSNGSGKSSLIKTLNGLSSPTSGDILFQGKSFLQIPLHKKAKKIVTLTQDPNLSTFSDLSILENCLLALDRQSSALPKKKSAFIRSYLHGYSPSLASKLQEKVSNLSGGERQTLAFAMNLWNVPSLLLLDEHTSALDPIMASKLMQLTHQVAREKKIPTLMTTHNLKDALQYGTRLIAMDQGNIILDVQGEKKTALDHNKLLSLYSSPA